MIFYKIFYGKSGTIAMRREKKTMKRIVYDRELGIEAYMLEDIVQTFPNHFHDYYVIGLVEEGERHMSCRNREYSIGKGDVVLFNPGDNHHCIQSDGGTFYYRAINIPKEVMANMAEEITGKKELPGFSLNVLPDEEIVCYLRPLHQMIMEGFCGMGKEELLLLLISALIQKCGVPFPKAITECREEVERACQFIRRNVSTRISLDQLCRYTGLSKSTLLRAFTREKGVTPYRYLEAIRIDRAKALLAEGMHPIDAAAETGFSDQSHFTNYFSSFIGLSPGAYREIFAGKSDKETERNPKQ